ncbi:MAG TPA: SGNH/GDSL hydrolase family protein [Bryobacteraceae bacterium]|nr:SGNH/GDSL hydrolase family protein [Bryobacteraceae bacterium]
MTNKHSNFPSPRLIFLLTAALPALVATAAAQTPNRNEHWVATWAASPQAPRVAFPRPAGPGGPAPARANRPPQPPPGFNNQTVRMVVRTSIGGRRARVQLSNAFGTAPLKIGSAHIALRDKESAIVPASDHALTFSGDPSFTIPPGAEIISDPVEMEIPKLGDLVISLYVPGDVTTPTTHLTGLHTTYISGPGDFTGAPMIADARTTQSWYWISSVDVVAPTSAKLIVAYGDSITDGATSTPDTNSSWPSQLAQRLLANKATANVAIVNEGISGNRVLSDGAGVSALARFDRDVLSQPGVKWVIVMEGINDIGLGARATGADALTANDLIAAHKQLIERAHMHGIKAIGVTLTPFEGASYFSEPGEAIRTALNQWIRTSKAYDAVIDFDAVTRDTANPKQIRPTFNIRDHLHPNDAGYKAMADAVDLSIFAK